MSRFDDAKKSISAAEIFLDHAEQHKAADNAIDAISRMYYGVFHSMKAYLNSLKVDPHLPKFIGHTDLIKRYFEAYKNHSASQPYKFPSKPLKTLNLWHDLREEMDYQADVVEFGALDDDHSIAYGYMKDFVEHHIIFVKLRLGI